MNRKVFFYPGPSVVVRNFIREAKTIEIKSVVLSHNYVPSKAPLTFPYKVNLL